MTQTASGGDSPQDPDLRFFEHVENTLAGTFSFVVRYIKTSITLCLRPTTVLSENRPCSVLTYTRPFTYLAVSVFLSSVVIRGLFQTANNYGYQFAAPIDYFDSEQVLWSIAESLGSFSLAGLLRTIVPTVTFVFLFGSIVARLTERWWRVASGLEIVSYAAGFHFSVLTLLYAVGIGYYTIDSKDTFRIAYSVSMLLTLLLLIGPARIFYLAVAPSRPQTPSKKGSFLTLRRSVTILTALFVSFVISFGGFVALLLPVAWEPSHGRHLELNLVETGMTDDGRFVATFAIRNEGATSVIVHRRGGTAVIDFLSPLANNEQKGRGQDRLNKVDFEVLSWHGGESPLLIVEPEATVWATYALANDKPMISKALNSDSVNANISVCLPCDGSNSVTQDFTVQGLAIGELD